MTAFMELLSDVLRNAGEVRLDQIKQLSEETELYLQVLKVQLSSDDPVAKKEARQAALELKEYIEYQMEKLAQESGMNFQELIDLAQLKSHTFTELQNLDFINK